MAEKLTLLQRTLLRLTLQLELATQASERAGLSLTVNEAVNVPQVMEQILALEALGLALLEQQPSKKDLILDLERSADKDHEFLQQLIEGEEEKCPHCKQALCTSCDTCHYCEKNSPKSDPIMN